MGFTMMLLLSTLIACQVMDNPGHVFSSVAIAEEAEHSNTHKQEEAPGGRPAQTPRSKVTVKRKR